MRVALDLGGFPLVDPVFVTTQQASEIIQEILYLRALQNELIYHNLQGYKSGLLHILAQQNPLSQKQLQSLKHFLKPDSFQHVNLIQPNIHNKTPLIIAFETQNSDFIAAALQSELSLRYEFQQLLGADSQIISQAILKCFLPPPIDQLSLKRNPRKSDQFRVLQEIRSHLLKRMDLEKLFQHFLGINSELLDGFDKYAHLKKSILAHDCMQAIFQTESLLWGYFPTFQKCQEWLMEALKSSEVKQMKLADQLMLCLFGSAQMQFGFGVIQLAAHSTLIELKSLATECPGVGYLLKRAIAPVFKAQSSMKNLLKVQSDFPIVFCQPIDFEKQKHPKGITDTTQKKLQGTKPDEAKRPLGKSSSVINISQAGFLSAFKLACLFQPEATDLQQYLAQTTATSFPDLHLETLTLAGQFLGIKERIFCDIFSQKLWLNHLKKPISPNQQQQRRHMEKPDQHWELFQILGNAIIENQDQLIFQEFLFAIKEFCLKVPLQTIRALIIGCIDNFNPACLVPIFALFPQAQIFDFKVVPRIKESSFKPLLPKNKPHLVDIKVTEEQVALAMRFRAVIVKKAKGEKAENRFEEHLDSINYLQSSIFFKGAQDSALSDQLVNLIIDKDLFAFHFNPIDSQLVVKGLIGNNWQDKPEIVLALSNIQMRFKFYANVLKYCSPQTVERFIRSQVDSQLKRGFFVGLFPLYLVNAIIECSNPSDSKRAGINHVVATKANKEAYRRKATSILPKLLDNAICFPSQLNLLKQAQTDSKLAQELANRFGVALKDFNSSSKRALDIHSRKVRKEFRYSELYFSERNALVQQDDSVKAVLHSRDHLRIGKYDQPMLQSSVFQLAISQKLQTIQDLIQACTDKASIQILDAMNFWISGSQKVQLLYQNLYEFIRPKRLQFDSWEDMQQFANTTNIELAINKRLISDHRSRFEGFSKGLLGFSIEDDVGILKFLEENKAVLQFMKWQSEFQTHVNNLYGSFKGITYLEKLSNDMNARLIEAIGDDFAQIIRIDIALYIIQKRYEGNENEDPFFTEKDKIAQITNGYDPMHKRFLTTAKNGEAQFFWRSLENITTKKLNSSFYDDSRVNYQSFLKALARNFDEVTQALELCDGYPEEFGNLTHVMVAFWIRLMNSEQVQMIASSQNFTLPHKNSSLTLMSVLDRDDLSSAVLLRFIQKIMEVEIDLQIPKVAGVHYLPNQEATNGNKILQMLIESQALVNGKLSIEDLPDAVTQDVDLGHLFRAIASRFSRQSSINYERYCEKNLQLIKFILGRISENTEKLDFSQPLFFTFLAIHVGDQKAVMETILKWVQDNNQEGLSALEMEVTHDERSQNNCKMLGQLLSEGRFDLVPIVKRYATPEIWERLVTERFQGYNGINLPCIIAEKDYTFYQQESDSENEHQGHQSDPEQAQLEEEFLKEHGEITAFFMALNLNKFELCNLLAPQEFTSINVMEYTVLFSKIKGGINPLVSDSRHENLDQLQKFLIDCNPEFMAQQFGALQLLAVMPQIGLKLLKAAMEQEARIFEKELGFIKELTDSHDNFTQYIAKNKLSQLILSEGSQDAQVLKFFIESGILGYDLPNEFEKAFDLNLLNVFEEAFDLNFKETHVDAQNFLMQLIMAFPIETADESNRLLKGGQEFAAEFSMQAKADGSLAKLLNIDAKASVAFDQDMAYVALLKRYNKDFLQDARTNLDQFNEIMTFEQIMHKPYADSSDEDLDEQNLINRVEQDIYRLKTAARKTRAKQLKQIQTFQNVRNILSMEAHDVEVFIQTIQNRIASIDRSYGFMVPRNAWIVNGETFKPKTTKDMSPLARIWFHLLSHYAFNFANVLTTYDERLEFFKLVLSLRVDKEPNMINLAKQMIKFAQPNIQLSTRCAFDDMKVMDFDDIFLNIDGISKSLTRDILDFDTLSEMQLLTFIEVVLQLKVYYDQTPLATKEVVKMLVRTIMTPKSEIDETSRLLAKAKKISRVLSKTSEKLPQEIVADAAETIFFQLKNTGLKVILFDYQSATFEQLNELLAKIKRLHSLFDSEVELCIRFDQIEGDIAYQMIKEQKTLLVNQKLLIHAQAYDNLKKQLLDDVKHHKLEKSSRDFVKLIAKEFEENCCYQFNSFAYKEADPTVTLPDIKERRDMGFLASILIEKPHPKNKSPATIYLNDADKEFLSRCHIDVSFVTQKSYDRNKWFAQTLNQYATRSTSLSLVIMVSDGKLTVCEESFLPLLYKSLRQVENQFKTEFLRCRFDKRQLKMGNISYKFSFEGFCERLHDLVQQHKMPDTNLLQYLFDQIGQRLIQPQTALRGQLMDCFETITSLVQRNLLEDQNEKKGVWNGVYVDFKATGKTEILQVETHQQVVKSGSKPFQRYQALFCNVKKPEEKIVILQINLN